ncbi:MAG: hypothetical protein QM533_13510, partial [Cytophagales bacterium]|nr:hypothetical protein [Cytophagales bacterium]
VTSSFINAQGAFFCGDMGATVLIGGAISSAGTLGCAPSPTTTPSSAAAANTTQTTLGGVASALSSAVAGSNNVTASQAAAVTFFRLASPIPETFVSGTCSTISSSGQPAAQKPLDLIVTGGVKMPEGSQVQSDSTESTTSPATEAESKDKKGS